MDRCPRRGSGMPPIFTELPPQSESATVVRLVGEFDLADAQELARAFNDALNSHRRLLVADLTEVTFIGSTVINVLAYAHRRAANVAMQVVLVRPRAHGMQRLFEITRLDQVIPSFDSLDDALSVQ